MMDWLAITLYNFYKIHLNIIANPVIHGTVQPAAV